MDDYYKGVFASPIEKNLTDGCEFISSSGARTVFHGGHQVFRPADYFSIGQNHSFLSYEGEINEGLPVCTWKTTFIATEGGTRVINFAQYPYAEALETVIKMEMSEGLTKGHNQLERLLESWVPHSN